MEKRAPVKAKSDKRNLVRGEKMDNFLIEAFHGELYKDRRIGASWCCI